MATPAPRRSQRIAASRDGSRAGSVVSDDAQPGLYRLPSTQKQEQEQETFASAATSLLTRETPAKITKTPSKKQARTKTTITFDAAAAIDCIMRDRTHIQTLTNMQKDAVISAFAVREEGLRDQLASQRSQLTTQDSQIEELTRERDEAKRKYEQKRTLRESLFYERVQKQSQESKQSQQQTSSTPVPAASTALVTHATPMSSPEPPKQSNELETSTALVVATPHESALETPRSSFFGRIFKTIASPFSTRRSSDSSSPQASQAQKPLGELPSSRKRSAPEQEPERPVQPEERPEQQQPRPRPTPQRKTAQPPQSRAQTPYQPATLEPISEKAESEQRASMSMPDPTPSRPPRSVAKLRRAAREQDNTPSAKTPGRVWTRQPAPKEPNADARLEKLRRFHEAQRTVNTMKDDEDIKDMVPRPTKRVKIDDLVSIPHNRPGDSESTFRVYDVDSDDEMEVDAEFAEIRQNIFKASTTQEEDDKKEEETPKPVKETPNVIKQSVEVPKMTFDFPSVGLMPEDQRDRPYNEYLGAKFSWGLAEWLRTGEQVVQW
ncbi:hypothetical protein CLAFUW4_05011 [Fulvia fulva]|uniref:Uncharacterized protein n=1 Tax=Passalora fulva TaxID=5499 RepID=A0A9Q8PIK7_PASFU|nr:uncharacterized protein CLAFUR5_11896 [Fulvia fulva]KAK4626997.1 hypothetical protein CLAFUR4_04997 [Fulvia fulva]KAK4628357.1 hypothetical protein CLAFUR0_05001 [Fulvia fulva]UJO23086.1 hypothetical protein CLAFUR5_11896 [Fulvia fulva]WPV13132.1 hypothetical protein CLAFUW4_05011 [Fulvia fulva]WPV29221.1 hypothetical protein CLAFUW7_05005 [Fulvia fulva]